MNTTDRNKMRRLQTKEVKKKLINARQYETSFRNLKMTKGRDNKKKSCIHKSILTNNVWTESGSC
jgi:hypothetical protein